MKGKGTRGRAGRIIPAIVTLLGGVAVLEAESADRWPQWGGPNRDFMSAATGLADSWPESGPPLLWRRDLGEGYASIVADEGTLFTLYRKGEQEIVVALAAKTGKTVWEFPYEASLEGRNLSRGDGPHSTPAIAGDRLFTVGVTAKMHALDRATGKLLWSRDLLADFGAAVRSHGYASSPLVVGDNVLLPVGGEGKTVVALKQSDGSVAWQGGGEDNGYSSPILIEIDGREELVVFGATQIVGLDPTNGAEFWSHPHPTRNAFNISTPLWGDDGILFVSSAYDGGGRAIQLTRQDGATRAEELWFSNQVRVHFGTAIRLGDTIYASSGDFGPAPLKAVDVHSGEVLWQDRTFAKSSVVYADGKLIVLDEDGTVGLVKVSREGVDVLAQAQIFDARAWTVPTLVGTQLFVRNREEILGLELGG